MYYGYLTPQCLYFIFYLYMLFIICIVVYSFIVKHLNILLWLVLEEEVLEEVGSVEDAISVKGMDVQEEEDVRELVDKEVIPLVVEV